DGEVLAIVGVVDGVGLGDADHTAVLDVLVTNEPDLSHLAPAQLDQLGVRGGPEVVTLRAEILEPEARLRGIRNHVWAPAPKVLDPSYFDVGRMHIDPVVRERLRLVHDQAHGHEVAIGQSGRRGQDIGRRGGAELLHQLGDWHAGDEVAGSQRGLTVLTRDDDALYVVFPAVDTDDVGAH